MYNPLFASLYNAISFSNHGTFDTVAISMLRDLVGIKEVCTSRPREVHVAHLIGGIVPSLPRPRHFLHLSSVRPLLLFRVIRPHPDVIISAPPHRVLPDRTAAAQARSRVDRVVGARARAKCDRIRKGILHS